MCFVAHQSVLRLGGGGFAVRQLFFQRRDFAVLDFAHRRVIATALGRFQLYPQAVDFFGKWKTLENLPTAESCKTT